MEIKIKNLIKNKRGGFGIILFFFVILSLLVIGFILSMAVGVIDFASDTITPIMTDLGVVEGVGNLSEYSEYGFGTANTFIQAMPWFIGFGYVLALVFVLVFIFLAGYNPHPAFLSLFFVLMVLLIFGSIIMSNMYQDIYTGTDEIATRLQEQTLMSFMILHSPLILTFIAIIGGVLMFARHSNDTGGFGV